jgi:hypothetical protein
MTKIKYFFFKMKIEVRVRIALPEPVPVPLQQNRSLARSFRVARAGSLSRAPLHLQILLNPLQLQEQYGLLNERNATSQLASCPFHSHSRGASAILLSGHADAVQQVRGKVVPVLCWRV